MLADAHRDAAEGIEQVIADIGDVTGKPYATRSVIELYWGAAFHWIAYGTQLKHGKHKENHTKLARYLRDLGEPTIGGFWDSLENRRAGGMYGNQTAPLDVAEARRLWQEIRTWATN